MDDHLIIDLFWRRDERAITACNDAYGRSCHTVAMNILDNRLDAEECVNDTWLRAWNSIPPERPERLGAFLAKIVRNLSLDKLRSRRAERRIPEAYMVSLEELTECLPDSPAVDPGQDEVQDSRVGQAISAFLRTQSAEARRLFVCRYFYNESIETLCRRFSMGESKVKSSLYRTRNKLKKYLEEEGINI